MFATNELLTALDTDVKSFLDKTEYLHKLDNRILNQPPAADKWSVAQVLAHLNSYNRYYLPHIEAAIAAQGKGTLPKGTFSPGWLGNYFTKSMYSQVVTQKQITNKMKSPKDHVPASQQDAAVVLNEFIAGEQKLRTLIGSAGKVDIMKVKVPVSIARFIKISVGDTLRFLIAHQVRHFLQISNVLAAIDGGNL